MHGLPWYLSQVRHELLVLLGGQLVMWIVGKGDDRTVMNGTAGDKCELLPKEIDDRRAVGRCVLHDAFYDGDRERRIMAVRMKFLRLDTRLCVI